MELFGVRVLNNSRFLEAVPFVGAAFLVYDLCTMDIIFSKVVVILYSLYYELIYELITSFCCEVNLFCPKIIFTLISVSK